MTIKYKKHSKRIQIYVLAILLSLCVNTFAENKALELTVTSVTSGIVQKVHVTTDQMVKKGDLLIEFDDTLINSHLSAAKAMLQLTQINLLEAKKELQRSEDLYERTVLSEHDLQMSKINYFKALAEHAGAENDLIHREWEQKEHKVYAPFSAKIIKVLCYPGQYINNKFSAQVLLIIQQ